MMFSCWQRKLNLFLSWNIGKNQMSEAEEEEDAIGGTCECKQEIEILVGSEGASRENGIGSSVPRGSDSPTRTDVGNSYLPPFNDDIALLILARLPHSKYCDLRLVNRRFRSLIRSGELNKIRKKIGLKEPKVFFLSDEARYCCYEPYTRTCWDLPVCPYDKTTEYRFKESLCVGTHLLVSSFINGDVASCRDSVIGGYELEFDHFCSDSEIWRYELELNRWFNCPMMITSRYFFAFADCDSVACVAGGKQQVSDEVLNSAEKYNPENKSWEPLPSMNRRRSSCSGFYMDSKFYVIGGRNENGGFLFCGEYYDFELNVWELIPNMLEDDMAVDIFERLSDHMVVVNNELYYLEFPSRHLKVYLKNNNTWKKVGTVPASIELNWGVSLKSLGNELLLIGTTTQPNLRTLKVILCFCTPNPELDDVEWHVLDFNRQGRNLSIYNYSVMMV